MSELTESIKVLSRGDVSALPILKAVEAMEQQLLEVRLAEKATSDAYLRIRTLLNAFDTGKAPTCEQIYALTESKVTALIQQLSLHNPDAIDKVNASDNNIAGLYPSYSLSSIYNGDIKKSGSQYFINILTDGENYIFVHGVNFTTTGEVFYLTVSNPTLIANAPDMFGSVS